MADVGEHIQQVKEMRRERDTKEVEVMGIETEIGLRLNGAGVEKQMVLGRKGNGFVLAMIMENQRKEEDFEGQRYIAWWMEWQGTGYVWHG